MFTVFLYSPYSNCKSDVFFENFSESKIRICFFYKEYHCILDELLCYDLGYDILHKRDGLVVGFMLDPLHMLSCNKMAFSIEKAILLQESICKGSSIKPTTKPSLLCNISYPRS